MKIGVFDSGIGGFTVLQKLVEYMPHNEYVYVADTLYAPYGTKTHQQIFERVTRIINFLALQGADCIVAACNTADAVLKLSSLSARIPPYFGILDFDINFSSAQCIGVAATELTIKSGIYEKLLLNRGISKIIQRPCQKLVELIENNEVHGRQADIEIKECFEPFKNADLVILGCTHLPLLIEKIQTIFPKLRFYDPAESLAKNIWLSCRQDGKIIGKISFFVTQDPLSFHTKISKYQTLLKLPYTVQFTDLEDEKNHEENTGSLGFVWSGKKYSSESS